MTGRSKHDRHCPFYIDHEQPRSGFCRRDDFCMESHCDECYWSTMGRILHGDLPKTLHKADWKLYRATTQYPTSGSTESRWVGYCQMWRDVTYVRSQAFERDFENEETARDYEANY